MCTVEVLFIADVMRRTSFANHNTSRPSARSVCRKLFANDTMDRRDSSRFLRQIEEELNLEMTKKWNFNFQTGTPLPGRYQWEPVGGTNRGPASSASTSAEEQTTAADDASSSHTIVEDVRGVVVDEVSSEPQAGEKVVKGCHQKNADPSAPAKQPKITDYMNQRKRHRTGEALSPKLKKVRRSSCTATTPPPT